MRLATAAIQEERWRAVFAAPLETEEGGRASRLFIMNLQAPQVAVCSKLLRHADSSAACQRSYCLAPPGFQGPLPRGLAESALYESGTPTKVT